MQVRFGIRLTPLVDVKSTKENSALSCRPRNLPVVFQVRTKCAAVLALANTSKQTHVHRKNKQSTEEIFKKNSKRIKVSDDNKQKWKMSKPEESLVPWRSGSRLEKKSVGDSSRRLSTAERRKKPKPK